MPSTLGPVDIANISLSKIGASAINSLTDLTNRSAIACNSNFQLAYLQVSRSSRWNCLLTTDNLAQIPQVAIAQGGIVTPPNSTPWLPNTLYLQGVYVSFGNAYYQVAGTYTSSTSFTTDLNSGHLILFNPNGNTPVFATPWAQNTAYAANAFVTYGNYFYQVLITYTSSANFLNDLTSGFLAQTDQQSTQTVTDLQLDSCFGGGQFPSGWAFEYALPSDFQLLGSLNSNICWDWDGGGTQGDNYEIMGSSLFCNESVAVIQYVKNQPDTTQFDALFTSALTFLLASMISTTLRQDGGKLEAQMLQFYNRALSSARQKNGGEAQARRFNPVRSSRLVRSRFFRYGSGNGVAQ
jgi:hypothetical protein